MATHEQTRYIPAERSIEEGYGYQGYAYGNGYPLPTPPRAGPVVSYQSPQPPTTSLAPSEQQASQENQAYQQSQAAFEPIHKTKPSRNSDATDSEKIKQPELRRETPEPPPQQREKVQSTGGALVGAASGARLGASLGGSNGYGPVGTIAGTVLGVFAGNTIEKKLLERKQDKRDAQEEAAEKYRGDAEQAKQDSFDKRYTQVAHAAPGYGSGLLPADTSHGGSVRRSSRTSSPA